MATISFKSLNKTWGSTTIIPDLNLEINDGEFIVLLGPSGCGKSTLLRLLAGLESPTSGQIFIAGNDCTDKHPRDRDIAMVFQNYALYPHMSVFDNIALSMKLKKVAKAEIETKVTDAAKILEIEHLLKRLPSQLSGGQRQRVAMGRAIVRNPKAFLFDEPLSNLDAALRAHMRTEIKKLHRRLGVTTVYVTHDQTEAMTLADRIVVLKEGVIQQIDTALNVFEKPANQFVAQFVGSPAMNFVHAKVAGNEIRLASNQTGNLPPSSNVKSGNYVLGVRPDFQEDKGASPGFAIAGTIDVIEPLGSEMLLKLDLSGAGDANAASTFTRKVPTNANLKEGQALTMHLPFDAIHLFDKDSGARVN